jgi:hypothetical protein
MSDLSAISDLLTHSGGIPADWGTLAVNSAALRQQIASLYGNAGLPIAGLTATGADPLTLAGSAPLLGADRLGLDGTTVVFASLPAVPLEGSITIVNGEVQAVLTFTPANWTFDKSFPALPAIVDPESMPADQIDETADAEDQPGQSIFAYLNQRLFNVEGDAQFILRSHAGDGLDAGLSLATSVVFGPPGLSTSGLLDPVLRALGMPGTLRLTGLVVPPAAAAPAALGPGQVPWDRTEASGIYLGAKLPTPLAFDRLPFGTPELRIYSPMDPRQSALDTNDQPGLGLTTEVDLGLGKSIRIGAEILPGVPVLFVSAAPTGITLQSIADSLAGLLGTGGPEFDFVPPAFQSVLKPVAQNFALLRLGARVSFDGGKFQVDQTSVAINPGLAWQRSDTSALPFPGVQSAAFSEASILVLNPFSSDRKALATLSGTVGLDGGVTLGVTLEVPRYALTVEQTGDLVLPVSKLVPQELGLGNVLPDFDVAHLLLQANAAEKTFDLSFSVTTTAGPDFPFGSAQLEVHVSNAGWRFACDTSNLKITAALNALAAKVGAGAAALPQALNDADLLSVEVSRDNPSDTYQALCQGQITPPGLGSIPITLHAISAPNPGGHGRSFSITGELQVAGMTFDLIFDKSGGTSELFALATNSDGVGISLEALLTALGDSNAGSFTDAFSVTPRQVVMLFASGKETPKAAFSVDLGAGLDLGNLPVVGTFLPPSETLKLSYALTVSSGAFTDEQETQLNELLNGQAHVDLPKTSGIHIEPRLEIGGQVLDGFQGPELQTGSPPGAAADSLPVTVKSTAASDGVTWYRIQRKLGPAYFERIGASFAGGKAKFLPDASLSISVLTLTLDGLSVESPLDKFDPKFGLSGIGLEFKGGTVEIGGMFLDEGNGEYAGAAYIKAPQFTLTAFGAYSTGDDPSLFVYALLDKALGGPAPFYVTGLAAGFGYNRDLTVPVVSEVEGFPLVVAAQNPEKYPTHTDILVPLLPLVPKKVGEYWLAAGIKFESFRLIQSTAVLLVKFGADLEFALVGLSRLKLPREILGSTEVVPAFVYVELAILIRIKPSEGLASAEALITANSFVIDKECRLSGGFAFYVWFDGEHKGNFVLTLGGYHPRFAKPAHYPNVPRLALDWIRGPVTIHGEAYFALTPSCVMAGGALSLVYEADGVYASLLVRADFLISWKPFYYDIEVSVSVKASWWIFHVELGAGVHIWGSEFAGIAHVNWSAISFDVPLGAGGDPATGTYLDWDTFRQTYLPAADSDVCKIKIAGGLLREVLVGTVKEWVVSPQELSFLTETAIPASLIRVSPSPLPDAVSTPTVGVRPIGSGSLTSPHKITISGGTWSFEAREQGLPFELWDTRNDLSKPAPSAKVVDGCLVGVQALQPSRLNSLPATSPPAMDLTTFAFDIATRSGTLPLIAGSIQPFEAAPPAPDAAAVYQRIRDTVMAAPVVTARSAVIAAARQAGFPLLPDEALPTLAAGADAEALPTLVAGAEVLLQFAPLLGPIRSAGSAPAPEPVVAQPLDRAPLDPALVAAIVRLLAEIEEAEAGAADTQAGKVAEPDRKIESVPGTTATPANQADIATGKSVLWSVTPGGSQSPPLTLQVVPSQNPTTATAPPAPVRVALFNRAGDAVGLHVVGAGETLPVPRYVESVLVSGPPPAAAATASAGGPAGWQEGSSLLAVTRGVFQSTGATVRNQTGAAPEEGIAIFRARQLVTRNIVDGHSGWLQIDFAPTVKTVAVTVRAGQIPARAGCGALVQVIGDDDALRTLAPVSILPDGGQFVVFFRVPDDARRGLGGVATFQVQTAGTAAWEVAGIAGFAATPHDARRDWASSKPGTAPQAGPVAAPVSVSLIAVKEAA